MVKTITQDYATYPDELAHLDNPPKQLFVAGELAPLLERPRVAIVGSRKASSYGKSVTSQLAGELAEQGIVIVSGLALGVDSLAHRAALEAGGLTLAVLPTSLDNIYPRVYCGLAEQIVQTGGALATEYDGSLPIGRWNFIDRNRIVAALSDCVLITEAAQKSGSLHTARFALGLGKDVLAVPGNITSPTSEGANNLIKSGALPVTSAQDVLDILGITKPKQARLPLGASAEETLLLRLLSQGTSDGTELLASSSLAIDQFNQTLTMLELTGKIRPLGANHWTLR